VPPPEHAPPLHTGGVHVRVAVPLVAHPVALDVHMLQSVHISAPHGAPSVSRVHASSIDVDVAPHVPD
jgi:hypothetical protein